jgi:succinate dehydrogenase / fumarate reductase cytochrome b subunit
MAQAPTRPLSPFITVWRWHITMLSSILHRASGVANYASGLLLAVWLLALAAGRDAFQPVDDVLHTPLGEIALYAATLSLAYHWAGGIRHLIWDTGRGLKPATASALAWFSMLLALAATGAMWALVTYGAAP